MAPSIRFEEWGKAYKPQQNLPAAGNPRRCTALHQLRLHAAWPHPHPEADDAALPAFFSQKSEQ
jgi:hypothetical protein